MSEISLLINKAVASNVSALVADAAQASLMRSRHVLSGEDSGLETTWDEICVQVQGDQTAYWDAYEAAMRDAVLGVLPYLAPTMLEALWLHTDEGWDVLDALRDDEESGLTCQADYEKPEIPVDDEDIARHIIDNDLLQLARNYTNSAIEGFLNPVGDFLDDGDEHQGPGADDPGNDQSPPGKVREIEYYDDTWDSSNYLVCFDRHYIFSICQADAEPKWEFLHPDGARWDAVHQRVYRNFRADRINRDQLPSNLPPPPDSIAPELLLPLPPPPPEIFFRADYPRLDKRLQERDGAIPLFLVLMEDLYESLHGDGKFHYPEATFFNEDEAFRFKASSNDSYAYYVRTGLAWLTGNEIGCEMPRRTFDHFSYGEVLRLAEKRLNEIAQGNSKP